MALIGTVTWLVASCINGLARAVVEAHLITVADNLGARRIHTQARVLSRTVVGIVVLIGTSLMLMVLPGVRQVGASLLASAGLVGLVAGFAARPVLGNMIAGLQIGLTQPIRLDDVVIVENEWGVIEEITSRYVVVRIWDQRRLVVPLTYWVEKPFQNWTRASAELMGTVFRGWTTACRWRRCARRCRRRARPRRCGTAAIAACRWWKRAATRCSCAAW